MNHGLVNIDDQDRINGETPVEDFGMFYYRDEPFPKELDRVSVIFFQLMQDELPGLDDTLQGESKTCRELLESEAGRHRLIDYIYFGGELKDEVVAMIYP